MSPRYVTSELRREIHQRALGRCEYCLLSQEDAFFPHEPDHIIAEKHGGATTLENLALPALTAIGSRDLTLLPLIPTQAVLLHCLIREFRNGTTTSQLEGA